MTMRATRDALTGLWETVWIVDEAEPECGAQPTITQRDTSAALAEVEATEQRIEALEAVAEAARAIPRALKYLDDETIMGVADDATAILDVPCGEVKALIRALAAFDAARDPGEEDCA